MKTEAPDYSGNDNSVRFDKKTDQPHQHNETRNMGGKKGHSSMFKETARLYPNLTAINREGHKTTDQMWKKKETVTKTYN